MKQSALQEYTKQSKLYGQNQQEILDKFVSYANLCNDPMNVYRYMEEKSICIYLANYWTSRANLFAEMGDFRDALLCLKEASSRNHIVNQNQIRIEDYMQKIKKKMVTAMKRLPPKSKRSATQYTFLYQKETKTTIEALQKLIGTFEKNYKESKKQIQKQFELKIHGRSKSWMSAIYEQNQQNIRKLSQKMKSLNNLQTFLSMRTPVSKKDPMRLTKTMDSVQMLKKKKSTQPKQNKKHKVGQNLNEADKQDEIKNKQLFSGQSSNQENDMDQDNNPICVNTTPVGRQLSLLSRKVTFDTKMKKINNIEKIRGEAGQLQQKQSHSLEKPDLIEVCEEENVNKSKSISKRGSILKNKKFDQDHLHMQEEK